MGAFFPALAFIGFGEAAQAFADDLPCVAAAYDRKTYVGTTRREKLADYERLGVRPALTNKAAVAHAPLILSLVTADRALAAAHETARSIGRHALYCDMNSVAPQTKHDATTAIEAAGGRYVDAAVMAPVMPGGRSVPILLSGPSAAAAAQALRAAGFGSVRVVGARIGMASSIKMIRSVMIKGLEALTTECFLAADRAGVTHEIAASLAAGWPGTDWAAKADYNLDRMMVHGQRRAAEMEEVVRTLDALGVDPVMTRGTVARQRAIGGLGVVPPYGLAAKLTALFPFVSGEVEELCAASGAGFSTTLAPNGNEESAVAREKRA